MSLDLRAYLRAKAIYLALVLEPPVRKANDGYHRMDHAVLDAAFMDYENARGTWKYPYGAHMRRSEP